MKKAAKYFLGRHDFSSFQATGSPVKNPVRTVKSIKIEIREPGKFLFEIKADAFLYRMVRNIVGTLLEVGRGKIQPTEIENIINQKRKRKAQVVPAYGLYLIEVKY